MSSGRFSDAAAADLLELWLTIAEDNPVAADNALDAINAAVSLLASQPEMGRARSELADGLRSFSTQTRYIVFYIPQEDGVTVIRVLHHARDIDTDYFS